MTTEPVLNNSIAEAYWREKIAQEIEAYIDADHEARAFTFAADIARGKKK
jgi:hypothetical protein